MGYPKAGSTFLQKKLFPQLSKYEYLSDPLKYKKINRLKKEIFYTRDTVPNDEYIESFAYELNKTIVESIKTDFIFSAEAICNFYRFNGELNLINLSKVIKILQKNNSITIKLLSIIRRQDEMLHSVFSYSYDIFRNDYKDINYFITDLEESKFNQLVRYLDYSKIQQHFINENNIKVCFLLFEDLVNNPTKFLKDINYFIENGLDLKNINTEVVNSNSINDKKIINSQKFYLLLRLHLYLKKYSGYRFLMPPRLRNAFKKNNLLNPKTFSQMDKENVDLVLKKYREANISFANNNDCYDQMIQYKYI